MLISAGITVKNGPPTARVMAQVLTYGYDNADRDAGHRTSATGDLATFVQATGANNTDAAYPPNPLWIDVGINAHKSDWMRLLDCHFRRKGVLGTPRLARAVTVSGVSGRTIAGMLSVALLAVAFDSTHAATPMTADALGSLGRQLFFDTHLSADRKVSCATCHQPDHAFQDGLRVARGAFGQEGTRNTPSLLNVATEKSLFWDGRRETLEEQAIDPLLNPREHGMKDMDSLLATLDSLPEYGPLFDAANAERHAHPQRRIDPQTLVQALAAFEMQLVDGDSPFEKFLHGGDARAISPTAQEGWKLFSGRAQCIACHQVGAQSPALFTDHAFHALPSTTRPAGQALADLVDRFIVARQAGRSLDAILLSDAKMSELGRFVVTESPADIGKFKTPSLRNVALTAPYMHDGSVPTLREAVDLEIYYRGSEDGHPLILTDAEKSELIAFLNSLTSFDPRRLQAAGLSAPVSAPASTPR